MLRWRVISAVVLIAGLSAACWLDLNHPPFGLGGLWLLPLGVAALVLASIEAARLMFPAGALPHVLALTVGNLLIASTAALPLCGPPLSTVAPLERLAWPMMAFVVAMMGAFAVQMRDYQTGERAVGGLARAVLGLAYIGVLMNLFFALRFVGDSLTGFVALVSVIIVVKLSDIGAYAVGRLLGGKIFRGWKLAPRLSPKKTLEGAIGGVLAGCLGAWFALCVLPGLLQAGGRPPVAVGMWIAYGVTLTLCGMFGDLAESLLKREAGAKDSGWLPGLGGILDLMDSLLFSAPAAYLF
ncbi:MAG: phosphatidate cytidylyltransferase, partial [Planctomycetales bacterium]|nr:phosphatidate cytidylyltransferase [Planctomycetales bacterium]